MLPVLFFLFLGFMELSLVIAGNSAGSNAARDGVRVGVLQYENADIDGSPNNLAIKAAVSAQAREDGQGHAHRHRAVHQGGLGGRDRLHEGRRRLRRRGRSRSDPGHGHLDAARRDRVHALRSHRDGPRHHPGCARLLTRRESAGGVLRRSGPGWCRNASDCERTVDTGEPHAAPQWRQLPSPHRHPRRREQRRLRSRRTTASRQRSRSRSGVDDVLVPVTIVDDDEIEGDELLYRGDHRPHGQSIHCQRHRRAARPCAGHHPQRRRRHHPAEPDHRSVLGARLLARRPPRLRGGRVQRASRRPWQLVDRQRWARRSHARRRRCSAARPRPWSSP